jgi:type II secretory pathway pseudopilin PulG
MISKRSHRYHEDSGAALLLAVGFVLMISAVAGGLTALATSSLNNRQTLEQLRNREYAADGAIESAVSQARVQPCSSGSGFIVDGTMNGVSIRVDWVNSCGLSVTSSDGTPVAQRNVLFSACENDTTGAVCAENKIIIRARINFEESSTGVTKTRVQAWSVNR